MILVERLLLRLLCCRQSYHALTDDFCADEGVNVGQISTVAGQAVVHEEDNFVAYLALVLELFEHLREPVLYSVRLKQYLFDLRHAQNEVGESQNDLFQNEHAFEGLHLMA